MINVLGPVPMTDHEWNALYASLPSRFARLSTNQESDFRAATRIILSASGSGRSKATRVRIAGSHCNFSVDSDEFIDEDSDDDNYAPPCETIYRGPLSPIDNKTRPRRLRIKLRKQPSQTISFR